MSGHPEHEKLQAVQEQTQAMDTGWMAGADPSWFSRVLRVLQRDWPQVADQAWDRAITENATEIRQREAAANGR